MWRANELGTNYGGYYIWMGYTIDRCILGSGGISMIFDIGPFRLYRTSSTDTLSITLICCDNQPWGWEYGWEDAMANRHPWIDIRVGKLKVLGLTIWKNGFEFCFLGLWVII